MFRSPIQRVLNWWIIWISILSGGGLYWFGRSILNQGGQRDFHINLLVEAIGLFAALAIAWLLIERHSQEQNRKIRRGVHERILKLRNHACGPVTELVSRLQERGNYDPQKTGPYYFRHNYNEIREALRIPDNRNFRPIISEDSRIEMEESRRLILWNWTFENFVQFSDSCKRTILLYGPGLAEYPDLLDILEHIYISVEKEAESWKKHKAELERKQAWRDETNIMRMRRNDLDLEKPPPFGDVVPQAAILNMQSIATLLLSFVANVTNILGDWDEIPAEKDKGLRSGSLGWP